MVCIWGGNFSYPHWQSHINPVPITDDDSKKQPPTNDISDQDKQNLPKVDIPENKTITPPNEETPTNNQPLTVQPEAPKQNYPDGVIPVSSVNNSMIGSTVYIMGSARYTGEGKGGDIVYFNFNDMYGNGSIKLVIFDGLTTGKTKKRILNNSNVVKIRGEVAEYNGVVDIIVRYVYE